MDRAARAARPPSASASVMTAAMRGLVPAHPLLTTPNRIGAADWEGWVQERGIQFLAARDPRHRPGAGGSRSASSLAGWLNGAPAKNYSLLLSSAILPLASRGGRSGRLG